jgi:Flp pilus assembly protein TadG
MLTRRRGHAPERGQILIMFAFSLVFLIVGMITVAVDLSELYEAHVRLQDAAEQAALAGASQVDYVAAESGSAALLPSFASVCGSAGDDFSRVVGSTTCINPPGGTEVEATVAMPVAVSMPIPGMGGTFTVSASYTAAPVLGAQAPAG